jgi:putative tryptophan/tyrosine transport system substrate-binding protein
MPCAGPGADMRRREFITLVGSAAAWPLTTRAQQPVMPVVGFLYPGAPEPNANFAAAFRKGLSETSYVEGQNVTIEYRWAENQLERLPGLAADLVRRQVSVIAVGGNIDSVQAAKTATSTIPIVFAIGNDPVKAGLVASLSRPGGNVTGIVTINSDLGAKWVGLLHELLPGATRFALLVNSDSPLTADSMIKDVQAAASTIGRQTEVLYASTKRDIDAAFASLVQKRLGALLITPDPLLFENRAQIATLALRDAVPAIYAIRAFPDAGGLMSYGSSFADIFRQAGVYAGRILKGEKPGDLPVIQATKFELVINLKTAKALGLEIPPMLLARADEVIE